MTFADWQSLAPAAAAHELHECLKTRLPATQQRAAVAELLPERELCEAFEHSNRHRPLDRVPCFVKDLFDVRGWPTRAGSTFLPEVRPAPDRDSAIVTALRSAGAVIAGKTHLHEFAYGITGENPHYGDCEHPRFPGRTSGGSSSGSAALVAAGVTPLALGTDTGGSIRVPAAFCGIYGLRLGVGHRFGDEVFPLAPSFDTAGWFTATAGDMLTVLEALVGAPASNSTPSGMYLEPAGLDSDVAAASRTAAAELAPAADDLSRATLLAGFEGNLDTYNRVVAAEAWTTHAAWADRFRERYDPAVWQRLQRGRTATRREIERTHVDLAAARLRWAKYFLAYDFLVLPATPFGALTKAACTAENRQRLLALTTPVSLAGLPVLTIPVPLPSGLTTGLQIVVNDARSPVLRWLLQRRAAPAA